MLAWHALCGRWSQRLEWALRGSRWDEANLLIKASTQKKEKHCHSGIYKPILCHEAAMSAYLYLLSVLRRPMSVKLQ